MDQDFEDQHEHATATKAGLGTIRFCLIDDADKAIHWSPMENAEDPRDAPWHCMTLQQYEWLMANATSTHQILEHLQDTRPADHVV